MSADLIARLRELSRRGHWPLIGDEAADLIEQQAAEIARLQAERDTAHEARRQAQQARVDALALAARAGVDARREARAEVDALRVDAERYRFMRDADRSDCLTPELALYAMESLDEYVDAAMEDEAALIAAREST